MQNRWVANSPNPFAAWEITFPPGKEAEDIERLLRFASGVVRSGSEQEVFRLVETRGPDAYQDSLWPSYGDYLVEAAETRGQIPLFNLGYGVGETDQGRAISPGKICYYNQSDMRLEAEVNNIGALLKRLRPAAAEWAGDMMQSVAPVTIHGGIYHTGENALVKHSGRPVQVIIALDPDIWFPWVMGYLEEEFPAKNARGMYDNRELAACHTPRLNRFLSSIHDLVVDLGGKWKRRPPKPGVEVYAPMVGNSEIVLE